MESMSDRIVAVTAGAWPAGPVRGDAAVSRPARDPGKGNDVRILIADDHDLVRETLAAYLLSEGMQVVRTAPSLPRAIEEIEKTGAFDMVLLDYNMPGMNGLSGLRRVLDLNAGKPVAILSGSASREVADAAVAAGAAGFIPKSLASRSVVAAVRHMVRGEVYAPFRMAEPETPAPPTPAPSDTLTRREREVLQALADGRSEEAIATDLQLEPVAVRLLVRTIRRKLGEVDPAQALRPAPTRDIA